MSHIEFKQKTRFEKNKLKLNRSGIKCECCGVNKRGKRLYRKTPRFVLRAVALGKKVNYYPFGMGGENPEFVKYKWKKYFRVERYIEEEEEEEEEEKEEKETKVEYVYYYSDQSRPAHWRIFHNHEYYAKINVWLFLWRLYYETDTVKYKVYTYDEEGFRSVKPTSFRRKSSYLFVKLPKDVFKYLLEWI